MVSPGVSPVTWELGELGLVIEAVPEMILHNPVPIAGEFPANVVEVTLHRFWFGPAFDVVGLRYTNSDISLKLLVHDGLEIVHLITTPVPGVRPVKVVVGLSGSVIVADPEIIVHSPVPTIAVFPARVVEVTLQSSWSGPALAGVKEFSTFNTTSSESLGQTPLDIFHLSV
jgi:hypothetical protein